MEVKNNRTIKRQISVHMPLSPDGDVVRIKTERKGSGKTKTAIILFIALCSLILLGLTHMWLINLYIGYLVIALVLDVLTAIYILNTGKYGHSKGVWIFLVLLFFPAGYLIYFLSNEEVFYLGARRRYRKILRDTAGFLSGDEIAGVQDNVKKDCVYLNKSSGVKPYFGGKAQYFSSGAGAFDDMLEECARAQNFIFIEYYIIAEGVLLARLLDVLEERVAAGVDVRIIRDDMGSHGRMSRKVKRRIKDAGIKMYTFNKLVPIYKIGMNFRDHRKITVIDGKVAYTGGINIADEYINEKRMYGYWKDNGVKVEGRAVDGFTLMFLRQWQFVTKKAFDYSPYLNITAQDKQEDGEERSLFLPYSTGMEYKEWIARDMYASVISGAQEKLYIMTPYFVPDETILNLLKTKAMSGVDVRLVLPGIPDKAMVYMISLDNADKLTRYGVKVYTVPETFVHTKSVLTEYCAIIGSINFDVRSFFQQYESALYTTDKEVMNGLEQDFNGIFPEGIQRNFVRRKKGIIKCAATALLQIVSPLM